MKRFAFVLLISILAPFVRARDDATETACKTALRFLESATTVAMVGGEIFFDGGSLQFTFESGSGERFSFVFSAYQHRRTPEKPLSLYDGRNIRLVPDSFYDQIAARLRVVLSAGWESGLQKRWPEFAPEAEALLQLFAHPGSEQDLDPLHERGAARFKAAHEAFLARSAKSGK